MNTELVTFNGISGADGRYLLPPMAPEDLGRIALGQPWKHEHLEDLKSRHQDTPATWALRPDRGDNQKLSEAGWGVIFPADADPSQVQAIREALSELRSHREKQAGELYKEFYREPHIGYRLGDTKDEFLSRHHVGPGDVDPEFVPFYLLIVADPQSIPYVFQYELDVQYAVGRIHFDTLDEYAQYARSVVEAETMGKVSLPRRAAFFGVANEGDAATQLSAEHLVKPLAEYVAEEDQWGWEAQLIPSEECTRARLEQLLGGDETPAFLFTASHGVGFPYEHKLQMPFQGALLCQDWPGPDAWWESDELDRDYYLGAENIGADANLLGLICFHFACFGAGTPRWDNFAQQAFRTRSALAPHAFLAALSRRLLSHPKGGALAVIGPIDRAWSYSFKWGEAGVQTTTFEGILYELLTGKTVGAALDPMNRRYAEIATMLSNKQNPPPGKKPDLRELAGLWTANADARDYALIGDPAVKIPVASVGAAPTARPTIEAVPAREGTVPAVLVSKALQAESSEGDKPPVGPSFPEPGAPVFVAQTQTAFDGYARMMAQYSEPDVEAYGKATDALKEVVKSMSDGMKSLTARLAEFTANVSSLEVTTYVTEDLDKVTFDRRTNRFTEGAKQRALTHVTFDGDTQVCVPMSVDELDETLWAIHNDMVQQAMANRTAMMKAVADALAGLLGGAKVG